MGQLLLGLGEISAPIPTLQVPPALANVPGIACSGLTQGDMNTIASDPLIQEALSLFNAKIIAVETTLEEIKLL